MSDDDKTFLEPIGLPDIHAHCRQRMAALESLVVELRDDVASIELASFESEREIKQQLAACRALLHEACNYVEARRQNTGFWFGWIKAAKAAGGDDGKV